MENLTNDKLRYMFNLWWENHYRPSIKSVASSAGISYHNLLLWKRKAHDFGELNRIKLQSFLESQSVR